MIITQHSKQRIVERDELVNSFVEAKRVAKIAFTSGKTMGYFQDCPRFSEYLDYKRSQTNDCSIRVYRGNIYIWKGRKHRLVTAHPIPERFKKELEAANKC